MNVRTITLALFMLLFGLFAGVPGTARAGTYVAVAFSGGSGSTAFTGAFCYDSSCMVVGGGSGGEFNFASSGMCHALTYTIGSTKSTFAGGSNAYTIQLTDPVGGGNGTFKLTANMPGNVTAVVTILCTQSLSLSNLPSTCTPFPSSPTSGCSLAVGSSFNQSISSTTCTLPSSCAAEAAMPAPSMPGPPWAAPQAPPCGVVYYYPVAVAQPRRCCLLNLFNRRGSGRCW